MSGNGLYIGIPSGVVLCADEGLVHDTFRGRLYHRYSKEPIPVSSFWELVREMEALFDMIQFPRAGLRERSFIEKPAETNRSVAAEQRSSGGDTHKDFGNNTKERERVMADKDLLKMHGDIGTFIIRVQQRQGGTWQGRITWVDRNKTVRFRSILEMIKLIEGGIISEHPEVLEEEDAPDWED